METPHENAKVLTGLRPTGSIIFQFGRFLFVAAIDDTSKLEAQDELLVTIYWASDVQFSDYLPTQLWLKGVSHYLYGRRMQSIMNGEHFALTPDAKSKARLRIEVDPVFWTACLGGSTALKMERSNAENPQDPPAGLEGEGCR